MTVQDPQHGCHYGTRETCRRVVVVERTRGLPTTVDGSLIPGRGRFRWLVLRRGRSSDTSGEEVVSRFRIRILLRGEGSN